MKSVRMIFNTKVKLEVACSTTVNVKLENLMTTGAAAGGVGGLIGGAMCTRDCTTFCFVSRVFSALTVLLSELKTFQLMTALLSSQEKDKWSCPRCTFDNKPDIPQCEMCNGPKCASTLSDNQSKSNWNTPPLFEREKTNKIIVSNTNDTTLGVIREIKIIDQFEDETLKKLVNRYKTCTAICGYLSCGIPLYLLNEHRFSFDSKFRNIDCKNNDTDNSDGEINGDSNANSNANSNADSDANSDGNSEQKEDEHLESRNESNVKSLNDLHRIMDSLCDSQQIAEYISNAMQFIVRDRQKYIQRTPSAFESDKEKNHYLRAWVANYEISRFIQSMECQHRKYVVFLRCNQYLELEVANREEKELILSEEKPFGKDTKFIIEMFEPRKLFRCDRGLFIKECEVRKIDSVESCLWILDLHGHFNCAFTTRIGGQSNVVVMDTYRANHCDNPAVLTCFDLVFVP